jgi:hypothetical protein
MIDGEESDLFNEVVQLQRDIFARLDPFVRFQLQKRGVTVIQNIYVGYDSEYVAKGNNFLNNLVSVKLGVKSRTFIRVQRYSILDPRR